MTEDKIAVWADGTWCELCDLEDYLKFMSDDYELQDFDLKTAYVTQKPQKRNSQ